MAMGYRSCKAVESGQPGETSHHRFCLGHLRGYPNCSGGMDATVPEINGTGNATNILPVRVARLPSVRMAGLTLGIEPLLSAIPHTDVHGTEWGSDHERWWAGSHHQYPTTGIDADKTNGKSSAS